MRKTVKLLYMTSSTVWYPCLHSTGSGNMVDGEPVTGHVMHPGLVAIQDLKRAEPKQN